MRVLVEISMDGYETIEEEKDAVIAYLEDMDTSAISIKVVRIEDEE